MKSSQQEKENKTNKKPEPSSKFFAPGFGQIKYGRLVLAFFLASVLWFIANYESDLEKDVDIPVNYLNLPKNLVISNKPYLPSYIKLRIKGTRSQVSAVEKTSVAINIDLSSQTKGVYSRKIDPEEISLSRNVKIVRISPREVNLDIDSILEKFVSVKLDLGQPAAGYKIGDIVIKPSAVKIMGPRKIIQDINEVTTVPIAIDKEKSTFSLDVGLISPDSRAEFKDTNSINLTVNIIEINVEKVFQSLKIITENLPREGQYAINPQEADIKFYGPRSLINNLHGEDIKIYADGKSLKNLAEGGKVKLKIFYKYPNENEIQMMEIKPSQIEITRLQKPEKETQK